jgi:hypothetical protein
MLCASSKITTAPFGGIVVKNVDQVVVVVHQQTARTMGAINVAKMKNENMCV